MKQDNQTIHDQITEIVSDNLETIKKNYKLMTCEEWYEHYIDSLIYSFHLPQNIKNKLSKTIKKTLIK